LGTHQFRHAVFPREGFDAVRQWLFASAMTFLMTVIGATVWIALRGDSLLQHRTESPARVKTFSTEIAEGLRFRDFEHWGVDLLAFESMRVENLRRGGITLGAFNVLVIDGMTVNLVWKSEKKTESTFATNGVSPPPSSSAFIGRFKSIHGLTNKKFSSVRITRLAVNRWNGGKTENLFTAETAEAGLMGGKNLRLKGCRVFDGGEGIPVCDARVELEPEWMLVYRQKDGGEQHLPLQ